LIFKEAIRSFLTLFFRFFHGKKGAELKKFKSRACCEPGLERYLKAFQKPDIKQEFSLKDFSLYYSYGLGGQNGFYGIYTDAKFTFVLTYEKGTKSRSSAIACIGFDVIDESTILVKQIQGVSGKLSILQCFRWEKMLLNIVIDWAKNAGFKKVKVIRAESSQWYRPHRAQNLFMKYDVTARRSGFKFDKKDQTYVRILS